jgi:hypothetical protein
MTVIYRARPGITLDELMKEAGAAIAQVSEEVLRRDELEMVVDGVLDHEIAEAMHMHRQHVRAFLDVELADLRRRLANSAD